MEAVPLVLSARGDVKFAIVGDGYMRADLERRSPPPARPPARPPALADDGLPPPSPAAACRRLGVRGW